MTFRADLVPHSGEWLMRRDAERLRRQEADPARPASLALYRWERPTLSLGHAQSLDSEFDAEAVRRAGVPVVRRPTGGRAILHADEWTFGLVASLDDPRFGGTLRETFSHVARLVRSALGACGVETDLPGDRARRDPDARLRAACFASASGFEITRDGRKLVGAAQRRLARSYLHQGTILVGPGHEALVDWLHAPGAERAELRRSLLASTTTVRSLAGGEPSFEAFASALGRLFAAAADRALPAAIP